MFFGLLGKKLGMTQVFKENGKVEPLTVIEAGPCTVAQIKNTGRDGYQAAQLAFGEVKRLSSPERGHLKGLGQFKYLREFRVNDTEGLEVGQKLDVSQFQAGDLVNVTGWSKGKGFAGVVKRHGFAGGPKTHGQSDRHRAPGSIGATSSPGRVFKGMRMAGHMGCQRITTRNLKVIIADTDQNRLLVRGTVPGAKGGLLIIKKSSGEK